MPYATPFSMKTKLTNFDKVWLAIERLTKCHLVSLHDEANKYCYKTFDGSIGTIDKAYCNDLAGLGYENESKLQTK